MPIIIFSQRFTPGLLSGGSHYINDEVPFGDKYYVFLFNFEEYNEDNDDTRTKKGVDEDSKKVLDFLNDIYQGVLAKGEDEETFPSLNSRVLGQLELATTAIIQPWSEIHLSDAGKWAALDLKSTILEISQQTDLQLRTELFTKASAQLKKIIDDADLIEMDDTDANTDGAIDLFVSILIDAYADHEETDGGSADSETTAASDEDPTADRRTGGETAADEAVSTDDAAGAADKTGGGAGNNDMTDGGAETAASAVTSESIQVTLMILLFHGSEG